MSPEVQVLACFEEQVPGAGGVVKAQRGADGTIHLLLDSADGAQYVKSEDGGTMFVARWDQRAGTKPLRSRINCTPWKREGCPMTYFPETSGMRNGLLALSASNGATLVAWKNQDVLGWRLYDVRGQPQGELGNAARNDNFLRCIAVSIRHKALPRIKTS